MFQMLSKIALLTLISVLLYFDFLPCFIDFCASQPAQH